MRNATTGTVDFNNTQGVEDIAISNNEKSAKKHENHLVDLIEKAQLKERTEIPERMITEVHTLHNGPCFRNHMMYASL